MTASVEVSLGAERYRFALGDDGTVLALVREGGPLARRLGRWRRLGLPGTETARDVLRAALDQLAKGADQ